MAARRRKRAQSKSWLSPARAATPVLALIIALVAIVSTQQGWIEIDPPGSGKQSAMVGTDVLNLRAAPTTDADILGTGIEGDQVEVIGTAENGFLPVRINGTQGWMSAQYLVFEGESRDTQSVTVSEPGVALAAEVPSLQAEEPVIADDPLPESAAQPDQSDQPQTVAVEEPTSEPASPTGERWIEIDRSSASVTLHHGDTIVAVFSGRIGRDPSPDGFYSTAVGTYYVYAMNKGLAQTPFAEDTYLTDWVGFDPDRKNGIHSPVRDANGIEKEWQNQTTLGCVRLSAADAVSVFEFAELGMRVVVQE
jgi:lipoprotein-anchoring transpeptidase ErfK/SrfK